MLCVVAASESYQWSLEGDDGGVGDLDSIGDDGGVGDLDSIGDDGAVGESQCMCL